MFVYVLLAFGSTCRIVRERPTIDTTIRGENVEEGGGEGGGDYQ